MNHQLVQFLALATLTIHSVLAALLAGYGVQKLGLFDFTQLEYYRKVDRFLGKFYTEISLGLAFTATSGSLYMSQVLDWTPCLLCWYQRILIYPLVLILGVAVLMNREDYGLYVLPLVLVGGAVSLYHVMLQNLDYLTAQGCGSGVSCGTKHFVLAYVSIPLMTFTAILLIGLLVWFYNPELGEVED